MHIEFAILQESCSWPIFSALRASPVLRDPVILYMDYCFLQRVIESWLQLLETI